MCASSGGTAEQFKAEVLEEWTDAEVVAAWRKWHHKMVHQLEDMTDAIIEAVRVEPGMRVLDLACGTGDPSLRLAQLVGTSGHVTATDLSQGMVDTTSDHARDAGLTNMTIQQADAEALPFADASFDVVTSRIGAMYFVNIHLALTEVFRVLRPGGRVVLTVWGPLEDNWASVALMPFLQRADLQPPPMGAPQPGRFAEPGSVAAELIGAGFVGVTEAPHRFTSRWPGPPEEFWQMVYDIGAPFRPIFDGLHPDERAAAYAEAIADATSYFDGEQVVIPSLIYVATGIHPE